MATAGTYAQALLLVAMLLHVREVRGQPVTALAVHGRVDSATLGTVRLFANIEPATEEDVVFRLRVWATNTGADSVWFTYLCSSSRLDLRPSNIPESDGQIRKWRPRPMIHPETGDLVSVCPVWVFSRHLAPGDTMALEELGGEALLQHPPFSTFEAGRFDLTLYLQVGLGLRPDWFVERRGRMERKPGFAFRLGTLDWRSPRER